MQGFSQKFCASLTANPAPATVSFQGEFPLLLPILPIISRRSINVKGMVFTTIEKIPAFSRAKDSWANMIFPILHLFTALLAFYGSRAQKAIVLTFLGAINTPPVFYFIGLSKEGLTTLGALSFFRSKTPPTGIDISTSAGAKTTWKPLKFTFQNIKFLIIL